MLTSGNHLCLGGGKLGEDQPRAVTETNLAALEQQSLEVLGLARGRGDRCLFAPVQGVDGGRLADVWIPHEAHHQPEEQQGRGFVMPPPPSQQIEDVSKSCFGRLGVGFISRLFVTGTAIGFCRPPDHGK